MLPIAVVLPLVEQLLQIGAKLVEQAEAEGDADRATVAELQGRLNVTAAQVAGYRAGRAGGA